MYCRRTKPGRGIEALVVFVKAIVGSIDNANVALLVGRSLNTLIQLSLMVVNGDEGVGFDGVDMVDVDELLGLLSNITLSRKRVRALDEDRRKAISNLVVRIIVRG